MDTFTSIVGIAFVASMVFNMVHAVFEFCHKRWVVGVVDMLPLLTFLSYLAVTQWLGVVAV